MPDEGYERLIKALNRPDRIEELEQAITANDAEMQRVTQERDALLAELIERSALIGRLQVALEKWETSHQTAAESDGIDPESPK